MAVCIYCAQSEGGLTRDSEARDSEEVCDACAHFYVCALFEDAHDTEEQYKGCDCVVCEYFYDVEQFEDEEKADLMNFWAWLPAHVRFNFRSRVEYVLSLRPAVEERIHPGQLRMFDDESPT